MVTVQEDSVIIYKTVNGQTIGKEMKEPSMKSLEKMVYNGIAKATDGCKVEPDGVCPHGCKSWLLEVGLI